MAFRYLLLRLRTFRREYFELTNQLLKNGWSWIWHFTIDNFKYLYQGEIHQFHHLSNTVQRQRAYIDFIASSPFNTSAENRRARPELHPLARTLTTLLRLCLLPIAFLIYWVRRLYRLARHRSVELAISAQYPTEDMEPINHFNGEQRSVYLVPIKDKFFPRGLVIFRYHLVTTQSHPAPILYIDPGAGFSSEYTIALPHDHTRAEQEVLIELPPHCMLLELQVADTTCEFEMSRASITELHVLQAARYLKTHFNYDTNAILHALFIRKLPGVRRIRSHKIGYSAWYLRYCQLSDNDRGAIDRHINTMVSPPRFSIILSVDNHSAALLDQTLKSVMTQIYPQWELLITCREPPDAHVTAVLNRYERYNDRTRILIDNDKAGISDKPMDALTAAEGEYLFYLAQGDLLAEHALYLLAERLQSRPQSMLVYTDHDHIDNYGIQFDPCLKPDWNHAFFLGKDYIRYLTCYQTARLRSLAADKPYDPFAARPDLNLRFIEGLANDQLQHIPYILLHHRTSHDNLSGTGHSDKDHDTTALNQYLQRTGQAAVAEKVTHGHHIKHKIPAPEPLVSLLILTRDRVALLSNCIQGILEKTAYQNIEIILVDNGSIEESTLAYLTALKSNERVKIIRHPIDFNFSELNNFALEHASGEYIGLINNDISVIEPGWLHEMMGHLIRPEVGIVGAKLYYDNDTVQHAGVIVGLGGVAGHAFRHEPRNHNGYDDRLALCQELSCVTAACLLTKKQVYRDVGGLDEVNLRVAFNDVDFCLKVQEKGYKVIWTPFAELYHLESASRGHDLSSENIDRWNAEYTFMRNKWRHILEWDPYYNPNLAITDEDFSLAQPPRLIHPWERYRF